jgi:hypothetical protein
MHTLNRGGVWSSCCSAGDQYDDDLTSELGRTVPCILCVSVKAGVNPLG